MHVATQLLCLEVTVVVITEFLQLLAELIPQFRDEPIETLFGGLGGRITFSFRGRDPGLALLYASRRPVALAWCPFQITLCWDLYRLS